MKKGLRNKKKAFGLLVAAFLLLAGSGTAWGQVTFHWHDGDVITGQNNWGIGTNVIVEVDNGATVYIDGVIAPMNNAREFYSVTIRPATAGGTCTIKRGSNNTGLMFIPPTTPMEPSLAQVT